MNKLIIIFQLFSVSFLYGQNFIKGSVYNLESSLPLVNVNIYINNTSLGTISNEDGDFMLIIPEKLKSNTLIFSLLGFENQEIKIVELQRQSSIVISLKPDDILLDEVLVIANNKRLSGLEVVQRAFDNYLKNFPSAPYVAKGFIRHTEKTEKEYKWLVEGVFDMFDSGRNKNDKIKINVIETRKSLDNRIVDTAFVVRAFLHDNNNTSFRKNQKTAEKYKTIPLQELEKAFAFYDNHYTSGYNKKQGLLEKILSSDINKIRNYDKKNASFSKKSLKLYTFKIDTIFEYGEEKVFKVKFSKSIKKSNELDVGYLYIQNQSFAINEIEYSVLLGKFHYKRKATGEKIGYTTTIKFKEYEGKMYPFHMSHKTFRTDIILDKVNTFSIHQEVLFTKITTQNQEINNITKNSTFWNDNLFFKRKYNSSFWDNQTFLLESKEQQKLILDLEKKVSLKNQFEQQ